MQSILIKQAPRAVALGLVASLTISMAMPFAAIATTDAVAATDHTTSVTESEVKQALAYTPGVLAASDQVTTTTDSDSALKAATAGATIDVPKDASDGVTMATDGGPSLDITLPNADTAGEAKEIAPGVIAYSSNNGSANAVQATEDGGVRMLTVIDNPSAPTKYDYKVSVPNGGHIELTPDGGAVVLDNQNQPISMVSTPWAKDARGKQIKTWFTTDGSTLTQYVKHNVRGVVYPVTADPWWDPITSFLKSVWKGAVGCIGGRELVSKGVRYFVSKGGTWLVLSKAGVKWVPIVGWVSCGYGAWEGIRY